MNKELKKHKIADTIKWVIVFVLVIGLFGAVLGLAFKLDKQPTTTTIGGDFYHIGAINDDGEYEESDSSIYTSKGISVDGLTVTLSKGAEIEYKLFFYDEDDSFISATETLQASFDDDIPEDAEFVRVMITPTADDDGKVSVFEVFKYANMLKVTVNS